MFVQEEERKGADGRKILRVCRWSYSAVRGEALAFACDAALLDLVEERFVAHAELLGSTPAIPLHLPQRVLDDRALRFQRDRPFGLSRILGPIVAAIGRVCVERGLDRFVRAVVGGDRRAAADAATDT